MKYYLKENEGKFCILQNFTEMPVEPKHNYKPAKISYEEEIKKWKDSSELININPSSLEGFKDLVIKNYLSNLGNIHPNWYEDIKLGILIPEERVKIGKLENEPLAFLLVKDKWKTINEKFAEGVEKMENGDWKPKVRPEDIVDDEQEKLICDLIREVTGSNFVSNPRRMGLAKQKFKITKL